MGASRAAKLTQNFHFACRELEIVYRAEMSACSHAWQGRRRRKREQTSAPWWKNLQACMPACQHARRQTGKQATRQAGPCVRAHTHTARGHNNSFCSAIAWQQGRREREVALEDSTESRHLLLGEQALVASCSRSGREPTFLSLLSLSLSLSLFLSLFLFSVPLSFYLY